MIKAHRQQYPIRLMCRLLSVSTSGYYEWLTRPMSLRAKSNLELKVKIQEAFEREKARAGAIRITHRLKAAGLSVGRHRVANIMRQNAWRAKAAKKYKATTNSDHHLPVAPNLLQQDFRASRPDEKYVSDITYLWTSEGWLYLAVVMDLYSRMVVGWALSDRMTTPLVTDALMMALWRRKMPCGVIVHSDRGSQYCSHDYQKLLKNMD